MHVLKKLLAEKFCIQPMYYSNPINYCLKPTAENQPIQSDAVIFKKAVLIASVSIEISLTFLVRKIDFIFDHIISIGLRSGL